MLCCAFHERQPDTRTTQPKLKARPGMRIAIKAFVPPEQTPLGLAMDAGWTPESWSTMAWLDRGLGCLSVSAANDDLERTPTKPNPTTSSKFTLSQGFLVSPDATPLRLVWNSG
jgi:hypothetical protein